MGYTLTIPIALGSSHTGLTLRAQLRTTAGVASGSLITNGFYENGGGNYTWTGTIPTGLERGAVDFSTTGGIFMASTAWNPSDLQPAAPTVSISVAQAIAVARGTLALRTYHTFGQAITSTSTAALNTATKLWCAIKLAAADTDAQSVAFLEAAAGLTIVAGAAYTTVADGSIVLSGSSGAWVVTLVLEAAATALLGAYEDRTLVAEIKAIVNGDTVSVWDGTATISTGVVRALT